MRSTFAATLVVVTSPYVANVDDSGKFELADVPEGNYKLRIFYKSAGSRARPT